MGGKKGERIIYPIREIRAFRDRWKRYRAKRRDLRSGERRQRQ